jgi:prepilin-type N-terminal cleavage/methylation domain-containing protein
VPRRAFSLIELLVVIAIIGVVISLLLPALAGAQEQARRTKCLIQMQQLGEGLHVYANNSRSWFPLMPGPQGQPLVPSQWMYGGFAGLFSLQQTGDGSHGFGGGTPSGLPYIDGNAEPLLSSYLSTLAVLRCPSDREDRYYGDPYSPQGNMSLAAAAFKSPGSPARSDQVVSYNLSYAYLSGLRLPSSASRSLLLSDETNGPDLGEHAGYGASQVPPGESTPNSQAAGAAAAGRFAPADNHKEHGANVAGTDGAAHWTTTWWSPAQPGGASPTYWLD